MLWCKFLELASQGTPNVPPDILIVHLEENDLAQRMDKSLILQVINDLQAIRARFPASRLIWSNIIARIVWQVDWDPRCIDRAWRGVNREVCRAMQAGLGSVIRHPDIRVCQPELYRSDRLHLSNTGLEPFST